MSLKHITFDEDYYPFWNFLGLDENCSRKDVLSKYKRLSNSEKTNSYIHFAWKLLKDPFYFESYKKYKSIKSLYCAGFFIDKYEECFEPEYDVNFLTTPFDKIIKNIEEAGNNGKPYLVLLITGAFSPIHKRHIEMMELARKRLEKENFNVVGGYFSPCHDDYVSNKNNGDAALNIEKRVYLIEKAIEDSNWLYTDKWEGYYNKCTVNFTEVIARLEEYLNFHIKTDSGIKVCYVFGADNAKFARTFAESGYAVCIDRFGYRENLSGVKDEIDKGRVFFVEDDLEENISSTQVRQGQLDLINSNIQSIYLRLKENKISTNPNDVYAIRNDLEKALKASKIECEHSSIISAVEIFINTLRGMFDENISIMNKSLKKQYETAEKIIREKSDNTLSLDVYIKGNRNLDICRLFELGTGQIKPVCLINRPDTLELEQQIKNIEPGEYVLIEDDIASGSTLKKLIDLLPNEVKIKEKLILSKLDSENRTEDYYDIVDMRDFIFGLKHSGLVVKLPDKSTVRVPYILPYTSPISRAKIPHGKELEFSLKVWEMNKNFYESLPNEVYLENMDASFIKLMQYVGFNPGQKVTDIMDWHMQKLKKAVI